MKSCRFSKKDCELVKTNRKSKISHNKKNRYFTFSRDEHGSLVCGCCKQVFFTLDEFTRFCNAKKKIKSINNELELLNEENRKKISDIYNSLTISIVDLYVPNPKLDQTVVLEERARVDKQISDSINAKNELQTQLKFSVNFTEDDNKLIDRMYYIEKKMCCKF